MPSSATYGVDDEGFIKTEVMASKIQVPYFKLVEDVKNRLGHVTGNQLHGLHLYGSVVTGKAQVPTSDLDVLVVLRQQPTETLTSQIKTAEAALSQKYSHIARDVAVGITFPKEIDADLYGIGCFIKHLCVCVLGEEMQASLPRFKPTQQVAKAFNGDFEKVREKYLSQLETTPPEGISRLSEQISRKFIRTGFSLVTAREQSWTTDPQMACDAFAKYYPDKAADMQRTLQISKQPGVSKRDLLELLVGFGGWLAHEVERELSRI
ncbi:hypothetical protein [Algirhabdus cladophorae]|uniref:hypothetical protein n=1 Tax=Algirhabdus cladophorae TaxID=3377108 RepID=UPI003B84A7E5